MFSARNKQYLTPKRGTCEQSRVHSVFCLPCPSLLLLVARRLAVGHNPVHRHADNWGEREAVRTSGTDGRAYTAGGGNTCGAPFRFVPLVPPLLRSGSYSPLWLPYSPGSSCSLHHPYDHLRVADCAMVRRDGRAGDSLLRMDDANGPATVCNQVKRCTHSATPLYPERQSSRPRTPPSLMG